MRKFAREHTLFTMMVVGGIIGIWATRWEAGLLVTATLLAIWGVAAWVSTVDRDHFAKVAQMQRLEDDATYQNERWAAGDLTGFTAATHPAPRRRKTPPTEVGGVKRVEPRRGSRPRYGEYRRRCDLCGGLGGYSVSDSRTMM